MRRNPAALAERGYYFGESQRRLSAIIKIRGFRMESFASMDGAADYLWISLEISRNPVYNGVNFNERNGVQ